MSALIKRDDRHRLSLVRQVGQTRHIEPSEPAEPVSSPEQEAISLLEAALHAAERELASSPQRQADAIAKAQSEARAEGVAAGRRESEAMLAALTKAARETRAHASDALAQSETVALAIARAALQRIFGNRGQWAEMVADIIAERRAQIDDTMLLRIRVSAADFADAEQGGAALPAVADIETVIDPDLASGACLFELRLGEIEVGPAMQSERLLAFIDSNMASERAP